ncbi:anti sigma factor C-terminal domain-containing protein [Paenibacillus lautus]|uniref:anti sigma factor C-terminal domain-containing protein n=1 Tax=Paenibacillus lautus TaxID=1401 RepID=UPI003D2C7F4E
MTNNIKYNGVDDDKHRLAYLKKNGVQVYGATVTGPVKELEKLKEEQEFWEFRLGALPFYQETVSFRISSGKDETIRTRSVPNRKRGIPSDLRSFWTPPFC